MAVEESTHWRLERVSFEVAYGRERVPALLFRPRRARPPYQAVLYHSGRESALLTSSQTVETGHFDYIVRSGRAVLYPIRNGEYERRLPKALGGSMGLRDRVVHAVKDARRSLDYLETRPDIDRTKLALSGYAGLSLLVLEGQRLKASVLIGGTLPSTKVPLEHDSIQFAPRVRTPVLMVSTRYDPPPLDRFQTPLFRLLGVAAKDKRQVVVDYGHPRLRTVEEVREVLDWLDRYLGPVHPE